MAAMDDPQNPVGSNGHGIAAVAEPEQPAPVTDSATDDAQNIQESNQSAGEGQETPVADPPGAEAQADPTATPEPDAVTGKQAATKSKTSASEGMRTSTTSSKSSTDDGIGASLLAAGALVLAVATSLTVLTYLAPAKSLADKCANKPGMCEATGRLAFWGGYIALLVGVVAAAIIAVLIVIGRPRGIRNITTAERMNPYQYAELSERLAGINVRYQNLCLPRPTASGFTPLAGSIACDEAREHRDYIAAQLGLSTESTTQSGRKGTGAKWLTGSGYIDVWTRLHSAESALLVVSPTEEVISEALFDEARLTGSNIKDSDTLLRKLRAGVVMLGGKDLLSSDASAVLGDVAKAETIEGQTQARLILSDTRAAINAFRDARRTGLVRAKTQLMMTGFLTGLAAYAILTLAILVGAERPRIVAAVAFFLMGAVVGLFAQLRNSTNGASGGKEDDFGLSRARLIYSPLLSGLAAVGGVLVTAMIYASLTGVVPVSATDATGTPTPDSTGTGSTTTSITLAENPTPQLHEIFDLENGRFGLIVAAIFGLTPELLINRLQDQADKYKTDLQSTGVQTRSA